MTSMLAAIDKDVKRPSRRTRTASTVRLHWLMEEAQRLEIAARIKELRERGPFNQDAIADRLGIKLRAYQKVEKVGTTRFERCEELAAIHRDWTERSDDYQHVSAQWLWDGRQKGATPDLMEELSGDPVAEFRKKLDQVLEQQAKLLKAFEGLRVSGDPELEELEQLADDATPGPAQEPGQTAEPPG